MGSAFPTIHDLGFPWVVHRPPVDWRILYIYETPLEHRNLRLIIHKHSLGIDVVLWIQVLEGYQICQT